MKRIILFSILTILISCQDKDLGTKEHPFLVMQNAKVDSYGVEFTAEFIQLGSQTINEYGFVWSKGTVLDSSQLFIHSVATEPSLGDYLAYISSDLQEKVHYVVRPYAKTTSQIILGSETTFEAIGDNPPELLDITPNHGDAGDTIRISGTNFSQSVSRNQVFFGQDEMNVINATANELTVIMPNQLSISGPVWVSVISGSYTPESSLRFNINGHNITDIQPKEGFIGESIVNIYGQDFFSAGNIVRIGGRSADIISENESEIVVKLPYTLQTGSLIFEVNRGGQVAHAKEGFQVKSRWKRLNDFPGERRSSSMFIPYGNSGYLFGGTNPKVCCSIPIPEVWQYDFDNDNWVDLPNFPGSASYSGIGFQINGKLFYGLGNKGENEFWEFDPHAINWTRLIDFPGTARSNMIHFTINQKGYIIGGSTGYSNSRQVWEYNPVDDSWTHLGDSPYDIANILDNRDLFFQSDEKAYLMPITFSESNYYTIYEFDPNDEDFLKPVTQIPFYGYQEGGMMGFIIGDEIFIGGDDYIWNVKPEYPDFWKYDMVNDEWTQIEAFLGGERQQTITTVKDGIAYVMFGQNGICCSTANTQVFREVWTYDPGL